MKINNLFKERKMKKKYQITATAKVDSNGEMKMNIFKTPKRHKCHNDILTSRPSKVTFWAYDYDGNNFEVDGLRWDHRKKFYCHTEDSNMEFGSDLVEAIQSFALYYGLETQNRCHMAILGEERPAKSCLLINWEYLFEEMRSMGIEPYEYNPKDGSYNYHP